MAERVLVIEDDALVRDLVTLNVAHAGYEVVEAVDFASGMSQLLEGSWDLALVDAMLPGGDGFTLTRTAREKGVRKPILLLTARADVPSRVRGLDCGADDYLAKPFEPRELLLRVRRLLRRQEQPPRAETDVRFGPFVFHPQRGELRKGDDLVRLTTREQ